MKANLVLRHISAAEAMVRASPSTTCYFVKKVSHDLLTVCCSTTVTFKNFVSAAVRLRTHNPAQMAGFLHSGGTGDKMEMILAKVRLEELKLPMVTASKLEQVLFPPSSSPHLDGFLLHRFYNKARSSG